MDMPFLHIVNQYHVHSKNSTWSIRTVFMSSQKTLSALFFAIEVGQMILAATVMVSNFFC